MSENEHSLIDRKMKEADIQNREAYLRKMALDGYVLRLDLSDIHTLVEMLRSATDGIHVIAEKIGSTSNIYKSDIENLQEQYDKLWDKTNEILRKLTDI